MSEVKPPLDPTAPDTAIFIDEIDYDHRDARAGLIAAVSAGILILLVVMIVGVYWLYVVTYQRIDQQVYSGAPSRELLAIREREQENLHRYSFIDKEKGIVRIPIDRAMEILAADYAAGKVSYNTKTYPAKPEPPGGAAGGDSAAAPAPSAPAQTASKQ
ncbi:MAG: hypothetical protein KatS3mg004_2294 [Bryobacteraceae bacterium]|nr:MAG: hypothetical protein KatS3mg004_2294 [Bryobacteraceae bacterium]